MSEIIYADKNVALTFYVPLTTFGGATLQGLEDGPTIQVNPTLASGDAKHSGDGGAFANLGTLPVVTPAGGRAVKVVLSQAEMNYDCVFVQLVDQTSPKEWCDKAYTILTKPLAVNTTLIEGSDATNQIRDSVVDDATRIDASALNTLSSHDPGETIMGATDLGTGSGLTSLATAANLATVAGYIDTEIGTIITNLATVDTVVDGIKAVTDNLPDSGALSSLATASDLAVVDGVADAIKAKTDSLSFNSGNVNANIVQVNEVAVDGAGTEADPWGPV